MNLRDGVSDRIKDKLDRLKTRNGNKKLLSDALYPSNVKESDRICAIKYAEDLDLKIIALEPLIRSLRLHIDYIGDPDKYVAAYLLIGKAFTSLKVNAVLVRLGFSYQIVEITRSSMESLGLANLFLEEGQETRLNKWFNGEIIQNATVREVMDKVVNNSNKIQNKKSLPMKEALTDIYSLYSSYTHSGFSALFDFIDVFNEDFDFEQYSQFHYNQRNLHLIDNLYVNILLGLKYYYIKTKDEDNIAKIEVLLTSEYSCFASPDEIDREMHKYK